MLRLPQAAAGQRIPVGPRDITTRINARRWSTTQPPYNLARTLDSGSCFYVDCGLFLRTESQNWRLYGEFQYNDLREIEFRTRIRHQLDSGEAPRLAADNLQVVVDECVRSLALF